MLLRQEPPKDGFIGIDVKDNIKNKLNKMGFEPFYLYDGKFFYVYTQELKEYLDKAVK